MYFNLTTASRVAAVEFGDPLSVSFVWDLSRSDCYFSLVTPHNQINMEAASKEERDRLVGGFKRLIFYEMKTSNARSGSKMELREAEMVQAFRVFDKNGDGRITKQELTKALESLGVGSGGSSSEEEIANLLGRLDINGDGEIEYNEFLEIMVSRDHDAELRKTFSVFDKNGDGFITSSEVSPPSSCRHHRRHRRRCRHRQYRLAIPSPCLLAADYRLLTLYCCLPATGSTGYY